MKFHYKEDNIRDIIIPYFLYKGVLPDMSDKNIITLPTEMEKENHYKYTDLIKMTA